MKSIIAADLFCGAGGTSTGLLKAARRLGLHVELARAMSFPKRYKFHGNREQVVKQIGNAVPVELAAALFASALANKGA